VERFSIVGNTGYVGIGQSAPVYPLDVNGNTRVQGSFIISGNVGILTATPAYPLDINGIVRAVANAGTYTTAVRVESLSANAVGATIDHASQYTGVAQANKICARQWGEADNGSGGRWVLQVANTVGNLFTAVSVNAFGQVGLGNVAAGSAAYSLDVGGSARVQGYLLNNASTRETFPMTLSGTLNAYTFICNISDPQSASTYSINLTLVQSRSANAILKTYKIPVSYTVSIANGGNWYRCIPDTNTGPNNSGDFAVDVNTNTSTAVTYLRVVRTGVNTGTVNTGITAFVDVISDYTYPITLNYDGTTGTSATNSGIYSANPIGTSVGNVGILTTTPAYPLDVGGSARVQGQLIQNYPMQWVYRQTTNTTSTTTNFLPNSYANYTFYTTGSPNTANTIMITNGTPTATGVVSPLITFPYSGIYCMQWTVRFNASSTQENSIFFAPMVSATYGETSANSNSTRLAYNSTYSFNLMTQHTGYWGAGDTCALSAYSANTNYLVYQYAPPAVTVCLLSRSV